MASTRRSFMRYAALAAAGSSLALRPFGTLSALAQSGGGYKALVCIFLYGGNDANNLLVPGDTNGYANYKQLRGALALQPSQLLPLQGQSSLMLNSMMPNIQSLFNSRAAAFVANVGSLVTPITRAQYLAGSAPSPINLFSHGDQQAMWQTANPTSSGTTGWAGRIADSMASSLGVLKVPTNLSVAGSAVFGNGAVTSCMCVTPGSAGSQLCDEGPVCSPQSAAAQQLLSFDSGLTLVQADQGITQNALAYNAVMAEAVAAVPRVTVTFPNSTSSNSLGAQLRQILQIMSARSELGATRQIFFASLGGFDTHANQLTQHASLLAQLDSALGPFQRAVEDMGLADSVTSFTMSEFSRALQPNTSGGSDHAWGTNLMVFGGAVKGGKVYGSMPELVLGGSDDSGSNGRWIPTTASTQFAATLADWFGVPASDLPTVCPYLSNFTQKNLGFV